MNCTKDLNISSSSLRQAQKKYNNLTVWQELDNLGIKIKDANKHQRSAFYLPVKPSRINISKKYIPKYYIDKYSQHKVLKELQDMEAFLNGNFERKWHEIDYDKQSIKTYKLHDLDNNKQKELKLSRQLFCLASKLNINITENSESLFTLHKHLLKFIDKEGNMLNQKNKI